MASKAIPCRTCGQFPVDAVPETYTNADVVVLVEEARKHGVNDAIAAMCEVFGWEDLDEGKHAIADIREKTGVKE